MFSFKSKAQVQPADPFVFPRSPELVPGNLKEATPKYRRHATIAMLSLVGFVLIYLSLMIWFAWTSYLIFENMQAIGRNNYLVIIVGASSAFLAIFMAKGLLFIQKGSADQSLELKPKEFPRLFKFLHQIADEAGAPKPYRVFASPNVNAAVFYDLTLFDLIFPSRKNLEIGLGLVNVLTLSELKAVLAHEFGHFAQKSMAVGRWVYVAQQVATQIVNKRDKFDAFLAGLSRFDLRIAWVGWILQFVVWSIRSLIDTLLSGVILAQRALSREMEFQADLVSVSLTGSEALITSLHKLSGADEAMNRALHFAGTEFTAGKPVKDVFAIQSRILDHMRSILNDPHFGAEPPPPSGPRESHRVFKNEIAAPPRMWSTHPANSDREDNAKAIFVLCTKDDRSAWELFPDANRLREQVTARLSGDVTEITAPDGTKIPATPVALEDSFARLEPNYASVTFQRKYRGAYLGRFVARDYQNAADMPETVPNAADLLGAIRSLYAPALGQSLQQLRELTDEKNMFEGLHKGYLKAPGGVVRWRGEEVLPRKLPEILKALESEFDKVRNDVRSHDRLARGLHLAAARTIGRGWDAYVTGLMQLLHYCEHWHADITDMYGCFRNVMAVVFADGKVSAKEFARLKTSANELHDVLARFYGQSAQITLDARTSARSGINNVAAAIGEFKLPPASEENMAGWLDAIDSWVASAADTLWNMRGAALQELLLCEDELAAGLGHPDKAMGKAPSPASSTPNEYPRVLPGQARPRQTKLSWWDRFQIADGWLAASARLIVAALVVGSFITVGAVLAFTRSNPFSEHEYVPASNEPDAIGTDPDDNPTPAGGKAEATPEEPIEFFAPSPFSDPATGTPSQPFPGETEPPSVPNAPDTMEATPEPEPEGEQMPNEPAAVEGSSTQTPPAP